MKPKTDQPTGNLGMTANGSSRRWYVAVDETLDVAEWSLEIDGPQAYLVFQLRGPQVVLEAARSYDPGPHRTERMADAARRGSFFWVVSARLPFPSSGTTKAPAAVFLSSGRRRGPHSA